jgi:ankyrin repeat protein
MTRLPLQTVFQCDRNVSPLAPANPAIASRLQSNALVGSVAELGAVGGVTTRMSRPSVKALMLAAAIGDDRAIRRFIQAGASVNTRGGRTDEGVSRETALMLAAQAGKLSTVRLLIKAGADPAAKNSNGQTAIYYTMAIRGGTHARLAIARSLLRAGCPLLGNEIHGPVFERSLAKIRFLLEAGCPVNEPFKHSVKRGPQRGDTPLTLALHLDVADSQSGRHSVKLKLVRELVQAGADPNLPDHFGRVPLVFTDPAKDVELRTVLVTAGADPARERRRARTFILTDVDREKNRKDFEVLWKK